MTIPATMRISRCLRRKARDALGHPLPGQREEQQRQGRAGGEGQRQRHRVEPDGSGGARDDDGGQHRACARDVQHAERQPEAETACPRAELLLRKPRERLLEECLELREDQPDADGQQCDERHPADRVLGQVQQGQQRRTEQGDHAEAQHQARDHAVGPQRFRERALGPDFRGNGARRVGFRLGRPAALRTGEEDDRQHRQDARRDAGDQPADEADCDECCHICTS